MKITNLMLYVVSITIHVSLMAFADDQCSSNEVDLFPRLAKKYKIYEAMSDIAEQVKNYEKITNHARIFNNEADEKHKAYAEDFKQRISPFLPRTPVLHYLGNLNEEMQGASESEWSDKIQKLVRTVEFVMLNYKMMLEELAEDPFLEGKPEFQKWVVYWAKKMKDFEYMDPEYAICMSSKLSKAQGSTAMERTKIIEECMGKLPLIGAKDFNLIASLKEHGHSHPGHPISPTGFVRGNKATINWRNRWDAQTVEWYEKHMGVFEKYGYVKDGVPMGVDFYREKIQRGEGVFEEYEKVSSLLETSQEIGFRKFEDHPGFQSGIFRELVEAIQETKKGGEQTIFIDIFFLGQTIGVVFAHEIVEALESNPKLKVLIIRDLVNHYGHAHGMMPVYNYLRAYSEIHPTRMVIMPAELDQHPTGLADWMNYFFTGSSQEMNIDKLPLAIMAKSDHSKVMVINGTNRNGQATAFVSSKNWLDASGGITYDEFVRVQGPAATIVQDNYVPDMVAALIRREQKSYLEHLYQARFGRNFPIRPESGKVDYETMALKVVSDFDILGRRKGQEKNAFWNRILCSKKVGDAIVSVGENNHNGTILSALDQDLYLIDNSTKKVLVADQLFYERRLVNAAIEATQRGVGFDVLLNSIPQTGDILPANFPNVLYLDRLIEESREGMMTVKWKRLFHTPAMVQEYHKKTVTGGSDLYDIHISGSANKDFMTMRGAFRETQVMVFQPSSQRETVAKLATEVFYKDFVEGPTKEFSIEPVGHNGEYNDNTGAVTADLTYQFPRKSRDFYRSLGYIGRGEDYKIAQFLRQFIEGIANPYTFSLPASK